MLACWLSMGSWVATIVDESHCLSSMTSKRSRGSVSTMGARPMSSMMRTLLLASLFMSLTRWPFTDEGNTGETD